MTLEWASSNWLSLLALIAGVVGALVFLAKSGMRAGFVAGCFVALLGIGGLGIPGNYGFWAGIASTAMLLAMLVLLLLTTRWWAPLAWLLSAIAFISLGSLGALPAQEFFVQWGERVISLRPIRPWWLLALGVLPVVVWTGFRSLAGLGPVRRWVVLALRCMVIVLLVLALAEMRLAHESNSVTVLFVVDRSLSVPEETESSPGGSTEPGKVASARIDRRWERIKEFINGSVEKRGPGHHDDKAGIIVFGRQPRLEIPPARVPTLNFTEVTSLIDGQYTDIAAALKLASASFPEGAAKRIVLLSDGNENLGDALEQARQAKVNRIQIDVVPLAAGQRNENEVLVESVTAPPLVEKGSHISLIVRVRNFNPNPVEGALAVREICEGVAKEIANIPNQILVPGLNAISIKHAVSNDEKSYSYEAEFTPLRVLDERGQTLVKGLPGSKPQNKKASTHVVARGQRRILLIEQKEGTHQFLVDRLTDAVNGKFHLTSVAAPDLPKDKDKLGVFLSNFDSVILANLPAETLSEEQQEMIRANTYDQGCGLVMIGGPESYGAGGWQGTAVEKALPVNSDIKSLQIEGKGGLVLVMHASEMAQGNYWQKKIAKLAIEKLGPRDEVGVLHFDWGTTKWHIDLQEIGDNRQGLLAKVDSLMPGDMPDFDPALQMAHKALIEPQRNLATKHVIIISDGDPGQSNPSILPNMKRAGVTVSTVGVATHGPSEDQHMAQIARATGGRPYSVRNPNELPAIYTKETRLVSQSFIYENAKGFKPSIAYRTGPLEKVADVPLLRGFVRTTPKPTPSVDIPIRSPLFADQDYPILAYWHYGLGKAVAFTSDACTFQTEEKKNIFWAADWARSPIYAKFWEQILDWSLRSVESRRLTMTTEFRDAKIRIIVDARDETGKPLLDLNLKGGVTTPGIKTPKKDLPPLRFRQTSGGTYEAEVKAEEAGSYFVNAQATRLVKKMKDGRPVVGPDGKEVLVDEAFDSVRGGTTLPYSQEFAVMETNAQLLESLRRETDGLAYTDDDDSLHEAAASGLVFRRGLDPFRSTQPVWHWLLLAAGVVFFCDIAARRIALEPAVLEAKVSKTWERLRGRSIADSQTPKFMERLKSRKQEIGELLAKSRAATRYEGRKSPLTPLSDAGEPPTQPSPPPPPSPAPKPSLAPEPDASPEDFADRLLRAKKQVWKDKEKPK